MSSHERRNGGRIALSGFLYQIVGTLGLRAFATQRGPEGSTSDDDELSLLVALTQNGTIEHECVEDAKLKGEMGLDGNFLKSLVQFKYSGNSQPKKIYGSELSEIIKHFKDSNLIEYEKTDQAADHHILITNREFSEASKTDAKKYLGNDPELLRICDGLRLIVKPVEYFETILKQFAVKYGCHDSEIEDGLSSLVGALVRRTNSGHAQVETELLVEAFVGTPKAIPIDSIHLQPHNKKIFDFFKKNYVVSSGIFVRREVVKNIAAQIRDGRALIVLYGDGGVGKSVTMFSWADEAAGEASSESTGLASLTRAVDLKSNWVTDAICDAGQLPTVHARRGERFQEAIDRLQIANSGFDQLARPLFVMGLDGLDEGASIIGLSRVVTDLLWDFLGEEERARRTSGTPRAILVVTCRNPEAVTEWLGLEELDPAESDKGPVKIEVGAFTTGELFEVVSKNLPHFAKRFAATISIVDRERFGRSGFLTTTEDPSSADPIDSDIFELLREPVLWGNYLALANLNLQTLILDGDRDGLIELASRFTNRFCIKARQRNRDFQRNQIEAILRAVARNCRDPQGFYELVPGWITPSTASGWIGEIQAHRLYKEALSAGYIRQDSPSLTPGRMGALGIDRERPRWRWRFPMCVDYLLAFEEEE